MSPPLPAPSLTARLRAETRAAHARVEAAFDLAGHLATRAAYRALLGRLHGLHASFEAAGTAALAGTGLPVQGRAAIIARDLERLGAAAAEIAILPACQDLSALASGRAGALGAAYVLGGSALGGLVIARAANAALGIGPETGAGFFWGEGRATAAGWRQFCTTLDALGPSVDAGAVVVSADATFGLVERWLTRAADRQAA